MFLISSISQGPKAEACPRGSVLFFVIDVINDSILLFFFPFPQGICMSLLPYECAGLCFFFLLHLSGKNSF